MSMSKIFTRAETIFVNLLLNKTSRPLVTFLKIGHVCFYLLHLILYSSFLFESLTCKQFLRIDLRLTFYIQCLCVKCCHWFSGNFLLCQRSCSEFNPLCPCFQSYCVSGFLLHLGHFIVI